MRRNYCKKSKRGEKERIKMQIEHIREVVRNGGRIEYVEEMCWPYTETERVSYDTLKLTHHELTGSGYRLTYRKLVGIMMLHKCHEDVQRELSTAVEYQHLRDFAKMKNVQL